MATTQAPAAFISYTATGADTKPAICSRLWAQTGYADFNALLTDTAAANPQITDWANSLDGLVILIPTSTG